MSILRFREDQELLRLVLEVSEAEIWDSKFRLKGVSFKSNFLKYLKGLPIAWHSFLNKYI